MKDAKRYKDEMCDATVDAHRTYAGKPKNNYYIN